MCKKLIYLISFVVALSLASITYGDGFVIGNFEDPNDPNRDGWSQVDPNDPNTTFSYSTDGNTLGTYSLKIADACGGSFQRAITRSLVVNNEVNEFRKNLKVSLDLTRLSSDWGGPHGGWNLGSSYLGYSELQLIVEAGRDPCDANGSTWAKAWNLKQIANWGSWNGDSPKSFTYDYSLLLNQIDFDNLGYLGIFIATNWGNYPPDYPTNPFAGGVYYLDNMKLVGEGMAYEPNPADHAVDVNVQGDPNLRWTKGTGAVTHDVYFGTNFNDVNDANRASHPGLLRYSENQGPNSYDPGTLELYTTYYWRIDEVNGLDIRKGAVWDFMTAYSGKGVVIGDLENGMNGWETTWQGDTTLSYSSTQGVTLGSSSLGVQTVKLTADDPGYWIIKREGQLDLTNMKLQVDVTLLKSEWNGEMVHLGPLCVQASLPHDWSIYAPTVTDRITGKASSPDWAGVANAYITLTFDFTGPDTTVPTPYTHTDWASAMDSNDSMRMFLALQNGDQGKGNFYIDNIRLVNVFLAGNPVPPDGTVNVTKTPTLGWTKGKNATSHDVYFGTDEPNVTNATISNPLGVYKTTITDPNTNINYVPGLLEKNKTYYWRIDENGGGAPKGDVWSFTTAVFEFVDDFESYGSIITNKLAAAWVKGGGGFVGYPDANPKFAEATIVHEGGQLSMPFDYNNLVLHDSNATRTFTTSQDWTVDGVKSLELWYRGWPAAVGSFTGSGTYTMTASGEDIWDVPDLRGIGYHDEFHYAYKEITTGDDDDYVTIIAKVESVGDTSPWAKAGVMVRQSLDPNSKNGFMCITPDSGAAWQYREVDANVSTSCDYTTGFNDLNDINAPYWVKLEILAYTGNVNPNVDAYYSLDNSGPSSWHYVNSSSPVLTLPFYVGLAVTSHNAAATCDANFSNVSITAGTVPPSWSHQDIGIKSNVAAPLYVTLQDDNSVGGHKATVTHPDPNIVLQNTWQAWDIALSDFTGVDLTKIKKITLGVGYIPADPCGRGTLYFDDIRLYLPRCLPNRTPDFSGDCFVDYDDLQILASNWLSSPADPNIDLNKDTKINFKDFAILASQWFEAAQWPF